MGFQARGNRRKTLGGNNKATSINDIVIAIFLALKEGKSSSLLCFNWKRTRTEGCFQSCKVCRRNSCDPTAPVEVRTQKLETGLHSPLGSEVASSHVYPTCLKFWPALLGAPWQVLAVRCAQDLSHPFLAKTLRSHVHDEFPVDQTGIHQKKVSFGVDDEHTTATRTRTRTTAALAWMKHIHVMIDRVGRLSHVLNKPIVIRSCDPELALRIHLSATSRGLKVLNPNMTSRTVPETNITIENRASPNKISSFNHGFSGQELLVLGMVTSLQHGRFNDSNHTISSLATSVRSRPG